MSETLALVSALVLPLLAGVLLGMFFFGAFGGQFGGASRPNSPRHCSSSAFYCGPVLRWLVSTLSHVAIGAEFSLVWLDLS